MKLHVKKFTFNPIQENTYVVYTEVGDAVIIDPGCYERHEEQAVTDFISENELNVLALLNTHGHIDHVLGNAFVKRKYNVDFYIHESDVVTVNSVVSYAHVYGFEAYNPSPEPDVLLKGGEKLTFGSITFDVLFTPGHAPGHVVFYNEESKLVINGDVLFHLDVFARQRADFKNMTGQLADKALHLYTLHITLLIKVLVNKCDR